MSCGCWGSTTWRSAIRCATLASHSGYSGRDECASCRLETSRRKAPKEEGVSICVEMTQAVQKIDGIRGIYIMAVKLEEIAPEIIERFGSGVRRAVA